MPNSKPLIIVFSGKRKSGKDYIVSETVKRISSEKCAVMKLSNPIKSHYAKEHGLDYEKLLDSTSYKESHRAAMVKWGEEMREKDPFYFVRIVTTGEDAERPVWIVSDARRRGDIEYLRREHEGRVVSVRVEATEEVRKQRGWVFTPGIDDAATECSLDAYEHFDLTVQNNSDDKELQAGVESILAALNQLAWPAQAPMFVLFFISTITFS